MQRQERSVATTEQRIELPPGVTRSDFKGNVGEFVPASRWGVYMDGLHELRQHLSGRSRGLGTYFGTSDRVNRIMI